MLRFPLGFLLLSLTLLAAPGPANGQDGPVPIEGRVTDAATGLPVAGADVVVVGTMRRAATDVDGRFVVREEPGRMLRVETSGYEAREVIAREGEVIDVRLVPSVLDEVVVVRSGGAPWPLLVVLFCLVLVALALVGTAAGGAAAARRLLVLHRLFFAGLAVLGVVLVVDHLRVFVPDDGWVIWGLVRGGWLVVLGAAVLGRRRARLAGALLCGIVLVDALVAFAAGLGEALLRALPGPFVGVALAAGVLVMLSLSEHPEVLAAGRDARPARWDRRVLLAQLVGAGFFFAARPRRRRWLYLGAFVVVAAGAAVVGLDLDYALLDDDLPRDGYELLYAGLFVHLVGWIDVVATSWREQNGPAPRVVAAA